MKLLLGEIKGDNSSRKSNVSGRNKRSASKESHDDSRRTNEFVDNSLDESSHLNKTEEIINNNTNQEDNEHKEQSSNKENSSDEKTHEEKNIEQAIEPVRPTTFEILAMDSNTERKFLDNISFDKPDHLSEAELKSTIFNSYKTIETLQQDLM